MAMLSASLSSSKTLLMPGAGLDGGYRMTWVDPNHHDRAGLEAFIAAEFFKTYEAEVSHFSSVLAGCRDPQGQWVAALGFSLAKEGKTFLEQYLDAPLENEIAARTSIPVKRESIVEVGNLAARHAGAARQLIAVMTRHLYQQGLTWVAFTATHGVLNSFIRLRLKPVIIAPADPARLPDAGKSWGSYYAAKPQVMFGDIRSGYAQLLK